MQSMMGTRNTFKAQKGSKEGHSWNSPCDISGSSLILSSYENAFCAQKLIFFFNNFLSSVSLFDACSWEYYNAYVWCCWCRSRRSDVEPGCAALCFQAEEYTHVSWYSHEHVSTDTEVKKLLNQVFFYFFIFLFFYFFFTHKVFFVATLNYGWTTDVTWTILMMSLLHIWVLNVMVVLLSMQDQKALGFHQKYLNLCSEDERRSYRFEITRGWVINDIIFIFGWTIPLSWDNGQALFNCLILIKKNYFYSAFVMWNTIMIARYAPFNSNISVEWSLWMAGMTNV